MNTLKIWLSDSTFKKKNCVLYVQFKQTHMLEQNVKWVNAYA